MCICLLNIAKNSDKTDKTSYFDLNKNYIINKKILSENKANAKKHENLKEKREKRLKERKSVP